MVSDPRGSTPSHRIRRVNEPTACEVRVSADGEPIAVRLSGEWVPATIARTPWLIDQHWWRGEAKRRLYYRLELESGATTVFLDLATSEWFRQEY